MCMTQESTEASHLERGLDAMIRRRVESDFGENIKGRGTAAGMYVLRQMVEKTADPRAVWLWGSSTWRMLLTQAYPERWR